MDRRFQRVTSDFTDCFQMFILWWMYLSESMMHWTHWTCRCIFMIRFTISQMNYSGIYVCYTPEWKDAIRSRTYLRDFLDSFGGLEIIKFVLRKIPTLQNLINCPSYTSTVFSRTKPFWDVKNCKKLANPTSNKSGDVSIRRIKRLEGSLFPICHMVTDQS